MRNSDVNQEAPHKVLHVGRDFPAGCLAVIALKESQDTVRTIAALWSHLSGRVVGCEGLMPVVVAVKTENGPSAALQSKALRRRLQDEYGFNGVRMLKCVTYPCDLVAKIRPLLLKKGASGIPESQFYRRTCF